jgi:hypothetical protein
VPLNPYKRAFLASIGGNACAFASSFRRFLGESTRLQAVDHRDVNVPLITRPDYHAAVQPLDRDLFSSTMIPTRIATPTTMPTSSNGPTFGRITSRLPFV